MRAPTFLTSALSAALVAFPPSVPAQGGDPDTPTELGIEVSTSGTARDTLGVLVSSVVSGSPADRAGIHQRDRIAEINGMSLRISPEDVGRREATEIVRRRLTRELGALRPGDAVSMRVFTGARVRTVTVRLDEPDRRKPADRVEAEATLLDIIAALREAQAQLHQLVVRERAGAVRDTLEQAELELAELQRRLQLAEVNKRRRIEPIRPDETSPTDDEGESLRGLRVTIVSEELETYFGEGSARGLLVLEADVSWAPIRAGDVILRVDGVPATREALKDALESRRSTEVELLRRRRSLIVTLDGRR